MNDRTIQSISSFRKIISDFLTLYARFLVTYICALGFLLLGLSLQIGLAAKSVSLSSALTFWVIALVLFGISYAIRRKEITHVRLIVFAIWIGNVFGLLFSAIYSMIYIGQNFGYSLSFGGIAALLLNASNRNHLNIMESLYGFIGGMLCILLLLLVVTYGLSLKDRLDKEGSGAFTSLGYAVASFGGFCFFGIVFLLIVFYENVYWYLVYTVTGSMFYIYARNIFVRGSRFLKL